MVNKTNKPITGKADSVICICVHHNKAQENLHAGILPDGNYTELLTWSEIVRRTVEKMKNSKLPGPRHFKKSVHLTTLKGNA